MGFFTADAIEAVEKKDNEKKFQRTPALIPQLKKTNSLLQAAITSKRLIIKAQSLLGGAGEQSQFGRRIMQRSRFQALTTCQFGLPEISYIACGVFHGFAVDRNDQVYAWGLNNFG